jgi:hypothetical protein
MNGFQEMKWKSKKKKKQKKTKQKEIKGSFVRMVISIRYWKVRGLLHAISSESGGQLLMNLMIWMEVLVVNLLVRVVALLGWGESVVRRGQGKDVRGL